MWHKAKKVVLTAGQTEVKVEFPLPIIACNLMVEYADFYDNLQASAETLQCPRCSASVPANPGVCGNCGENVFQCHKCRYAIKSYSYCKKKGNQILLPNSEIKLIMYVFSMSVFIN